MVNEMSKFIYQYNDQILPPVWQLLTSTAEIYVKAVVNETDSDQDDDELNDFITLVLQLFEFIHSIVEQHRFQSIVKSVLTDLVYISIVYMQISEEQINGWSEDAELYVDDMSAEIVECSIRVSSKDVLVNIGDEFGADVLLPSISDALTRHVSVAQAEKNANNPHWWKIIEASVTAVGFLKKYIVEISEEKRKSFNLREYLAYTKSMLSQGGNGAGYQGDVSPFLHGRCLWVLSKFADASPDIYDRPNLQAILDCTTNDLSGTKPMVIQISAMRALYELCSGDLKTASDEQRSMIVAKLPAFLNFITDIAARAKGSILIDVLSTISSVASVRQHAIANDIKYILNIFILYFIHYSSTTVSRPTIIRR